MDPQQMNNPPQLSPLEEILFKSWAKMHGVADETDPARQQDLQGQYKASGGYGKPTPAAPEATAKGPSITHTLMRREGEPSTVKVTMQNPSPNQEDISKILELIHGGVVGGRDAVQELKLDPSRIPQNPRFGDINIPPEILGK